MSQPNPHAIPAPTAGSRSKLLGGNLQGFLNKMGIGHSQKGEGKEEGKDERGEGRVEEKK